MPLKMNWPYLGVCLIVWALMIGMIAWGITAPVLTSLQQGRPIPAEWPLTSVIASDVVLSLSFLYLPYKIYVDRKTLITQELIQQPNLRGHTRILWTQARKMYREGYGIHVCGEKGKIIVTPEAYRNKQEVIDLLTSLGTRYSIPSE